MTDTSLARCHVCSAVVPDTPDDRRHHISEHRHIAKQIDALARELRAAKNDLTQLRADLDTANARDLPDGGIRITDMDAEELDDTDIDPEPAVTISPATVATLEDDEIDLPSHPVSPYA